MLDGFGSVFSPVAVLLLVAVALGVVLGRYAWPRRPYRQDTPSASAVPGRQVSGPPARQGGLQAGAEGAAPGGFLQSAPSFPPGAVLTASGGYRPELAVPPVGAPATSPVPAVGPLPNGASPGGTDPAAALIANVQARAAYAEARVDRARVWVTELEARLSESQSTLKETWRQLKQTEAELVRMRRQVQELEDRKEAEMGRLESGAIAALESTIATHRDQVAKLEEKLRAAESTAQEHVRELAVERRRSAQLQSALAERDQHIATLMSERA